GRDFPNPVTGLRQSTTEAKSGRGDGERFGEGVGIDRKNEAEALAGDEEVADLVVVRAVADDQRAVELVALVEDAGLEAVAYRLGVADAERRDRGQHLAAYCLAGGGQRPELAGELVAAGIAEPTED